MVANTGLFKKMPGIGNRRTTTRTATLKDSKGLPIKAQH